jgi:amidohydrolase
VTRGVDPFDPAVITSAKLTAGTTNNIIPETAELLGTIRTVSEKTRAAIKERIGRLVDGICAAHGATGRVQIEPGYPVTVNDEDFATFVMDVARDLLDDDAVEPMKAPIMGAEDFSYVLQRVPGAMAFLGGVPAGTDPESAPQNHSNVVVFDEEAMPVGVALYVSVAMRHLEAAAGG